MLFYESQNTITWMEGGLWISVLSPQNISMEINEVWFGFFCCPDTTYVYLAIILSERGNKSLEIIYISRSWIQFPILP